jgi:Protein of unknown function (DUF3489)
MACACRDYVYGIDLFNHGFYWEAHDAAPAGGGDDRPDHGCHRLAGAHLPGAFAGALKKKRGLTVTSEKPDNAERVYRIAG